MLRQLTDSERNLSELAAPLKMTFAGASKHFRVLEKAKLVRRRVVGREHLCRLEASPMRGATEWMTGFKEHWEKNFLRLDALLDQMKAQERDRPSTRKRDA